MAGAKFIHKIKADIYRIDPDKHKGSVSKTINSIISQHNSIGAHQDYIEISLNPNAAKVKDNQVRLFVNNVEETKPDWVKFLDELAIDDGQDAIQALKRKYPSFVLFVFDTKDIFAVTKGGGHYVIAPYILESFGVEILERLLDPNDSDLRSLRERGVIGSVLASDKYFKPDHKFRDEQSFGKFYKSIEAFVPKDVLKKKLGIDTNRTSLIVSGENKLKISNQLSLEEIVDRVSGVSKLLKQPKTVNLNKFKRLNKKQLETVTTGNTLQYYLIQELIKETHIVYASGEEIEIYHPSTFDYLKCEDIRMQYNGIETTLDWNTRITLNRVFDDFSLTKLDRANFEAVLRQVETELHFINPETYSHGKHLLDWLTGEITYNKKKYFRFDGEWFVYENDFLEEIKARTQTLLNKVSGDTLPNWPKANNEGKYNAQFTSNTDHVVADTALYSWIEISDFFKFDDKLTTLYHVKNGWGQSVRVVYNQIMNGARFLAEIRANANSSAFEKKLKLYYLDIAKKQYGGAKIPGVSFAIFKNRLQKNKIKFVLVFGHENNSNKTLEKLIMDSRSNIAKLSLIQCENELRSFFDFDFDIIMVKRT